MSLTGDLRFPYADYAEAGKPYGVNGYPRWIHEQFESELAIKDRLLEKAMDTLKGAGLAWNGNG